MSIAEKVIEEFEKDIRLRKKLAELLITEPDIRLVLINAVIADVATKKDITDLKNEISELRNGINQLSIATKEDISELRNEINQLNVAAKKDISDLRNEINGLRNEISQLSIATKRDVSDLRNEISKLKDDMWSNFKWTIGVIITIWGTTVIPILLKIAGMI